MLPNNEIKYIQKAAGITSYYATALDTSLMALNDLAASKSLAKQSKKYALAQLLDYI